MQKIETEYKKRNFAIDINSFLIFKLTLHVFSSMFSCFEIVIKYEERLSTRAKNNVAFLFKCSHIFFSFLQKRGKGSRF